MIIQFKILIQYHQIISEFGISIFHGRLFFKGVQEGSAVSDCFDFEIRPPRAGSIWDLIICTQIFGIKELAE
jgi:hypothetical protein